MVWELMVYLMACVILLQTSSLRNRGYYVVWRESLI